MPLAETPLRKKYRIAPGHIHAYDVCQVPCLVIQEQSDPHGDWWDMVHVVGDPSWETTKAMAKRIIAALKEN